MTKAEKLLKAAIAKIESESIKSWASGEHNYAVWLKYGAEVALKKNPGKSIETLALELSTYMVLTAMG